MRNALHRNPKARKLVLLAGAAVLFVAAMGVPHSAQACQDWTDSDATHTTQVGWCEFDCYCQTYCDGERTQYWTHQSWSGCL
jgi:hypothetical protein